MCLLRGTDWIFNIKLQSFYRPWGPQEVETSRFQGSWHMKVVRLLALHTVRLYPAGNIPGTHYCWRLSQPQGHSAVGRIMLMKNSNDTIVNRTRALPPCSAVTEPTAICILIFYHISPSPSLEREMFQTKVVDEITTHILCSVTGFF